MWAGTFQVVEGRRSGLKLIRGNSLGLVDDDHINHATLSCYLALLSSLFVLVLECQYHRSLAGYLI